jgi:hypothetical protein
MSVSRRAILELPAAAPGKVGWDNMISKSSNYFDYTDTGPPSLFAASVELSLSNHYKIKEALNFAAVRVLGRSERIQKPCLMESGTDMMVL